MQAFCGQCQKWNNVDENSRHCSCCGTLFTKSSVDIPRFAEIQKQAKKIIKSWNDNLFLWSFSIFWGTMLVATIVSPQIILPYILGFLFITGLFTLVFVPIAIQKLYVEPKFPEIYNNPNWKP